MYKVFVNELPLILTDTLPEKFSGKIFSLTPESVKKAIEGLVTNKLTKAIVFDSDSEALLKNFSAIIPKVVAAGGRVRNNEGKYLFIFRNNKWDLPKGKLDKGEAIKKAAVREVEEETGVRGLEIQGFLATTYHIFKRSGQYKLKEVHWFEMKTDYSKKLVPQLNEGITKVKWKGPKKTKKALENSYVTIKSLFDDEKAKANPKSLPIQNL